MARGPLVTSSLRDPRLLLAVPLASMQTHSISVKQVQVVDSHLQGRECGPLSGTAHTARAPVLSPGSLQPDGDPSPDSPELLCVPVLDTSGFARSPAPSGQSVSAITPPISTSANPWRRVWACASKALRS